MSSATSRGKRRLLVTGFGKFNGVEDNPTTVLVNRLQGENTRVNRQFHIFEVSTKAVDAELVAEEGLFCIHLGVNSRALRVNLELNAYNNMDFRVPDEQGYSPTQCKICQDCELEDTLTTCIPLETLVCKLKDEGFSDDVEISNDPGRFLCNYVYYKSLLVNRFALFVHVPPFSVMAEDKQYNFINILLNHIEDLE